MEGPESTETVSATVGWQLEAGQLETKKITFPAKQNVSKESWQVAVTEAGCKG